MTKLSTLFFLFLSLGANAQWQSSGPVTASDGFTAEYACAYGSKAFVLAGPSFALNLYGSDNNGSNWTQRSLPPGGNLLHIYVFNSKLWGVHFSKLSVSNDDGNSWIEKEDFYPNGVSAMAKTGNDLIVSNGSLADGVSISTDGGDTWTGYNNGLPNNSSVNTTCLAASGSNVFLGTTNGIYKSSDNGVNWTLSNGILDVYCLAASGTNVYAGTVSGIYYSSNSGGTWTALTSGIPANTAVRGVVIHNNDVFAGTDAGVYRTTLTGTSWTDISNGLPTDMAVHSMAVGSSHLYASKYYGTTMAVWQRPLSEVMAVGNMNRTEPFAIYPSVSDGSFKTAGIEHREITINIYNVQGAIIYTGRVNDDTIIDLTKNAKGLYFYTAAAKNEIISRNKLLIQ